VVKVQRKLLPALVTQKICQSVDLFRAGLRGGHARAGSGPIVVVMNTLNFVHIKFSTQFYHSVLQVLVSLTLRAVSKHEHKANITYHQ